MAMDMRKDDTLKVRMDTVTLEMMEKARGYLKIDKSKFVRQSVRQVAEAVIAEHEHTKFSKKDWHAFFAMIDNPPAPTKRMRKAAQKYEEITLKNGV